MSGDLGDRRLRVEFSQSLKFCFVYEVGRAGVQATGQSSHRNYSLQVPVFYVLLLNITRYEFLKISD